MQVRALIMDPLNDASILRTIISQISPHILIAFDQVQLNDAQFLCSVSSRISVVPLPSLEQTPSIMKPIYGLICFGGTKIQATIIKEPNADSIITICSRQVSDIQVFSRVREEYPPFAPLASSGGPPSRESQAGTLKTRSRFYIMYKEGGGEVFHDRNKRQAAGLNTQPRDKKETLKELNKQALSWRDIRSLNHPAMLPAGRARHMIYLPYGADPKKDLWGEKSKAVGTINPMMSRASAEPSDSHFITHFSFFAGF
ncbi:hypothetical protein C8J56DRAFT_893140 [Mycena floridula]|nr:hypothetical protein C8J56DRAFT_893140 [Mycena floridula]